MSTVSDCFIWTKVENLVSSIVFGPFYGMSAAQKSAERLNNAHGAQVYHCAPFKKAVDINRQGVESLYRRAKKHRFKIGQPVVTKRGIKGVVQSIYTDSSPVSYSVTLDEEFCFDENDLSA